MVEVLPMEGYATFREIYILSTEKIYAKVPSGTLWVPVEGHEGIAAIVLYGNMEYAVDVIRDSSEGAHGQSFKGELPRYKLYIGGTDLYESSNPASPNEVKAHGFNSITEFYTQTEQYLEKFHSDIRDSRTCINENAKPSEGVIIWNSDERKCILLANSNNTGIIQNGKVELVNDESIVSIGDGIVRVQNSTGRNLVIDKGKILEPAELRNLETTIKEEIKKSLENIRLNR